MSTFTSPSYKAGETGSVQGNTLTVLLDRDSTAGFVIYGGYYDRENSFPAR